MNDVVALRKDSGMGVAEGMKAGDPKHIRNGTDAKGS